jgi:hypothetical protein
MEGYGSVSPKPSGWTDLRKDLPDWGNDYVSAHVRGRNDGEGVSEPMRDTQRPGYSRWRADNAEIGFVVFERREDFAAGVVGHPLTHLRQSSKIGVKEAEEILGSENSIPTSVW